MTRLSTIAGAAIAAAGFVCLMGPVSAAELTGAEIKDLISGKSLYMEFSAASTGGVGKGVIYLLCG